MSATSTKPTTLTTLFICAMPEEAAALHGVFQEQFAHTHTSALQDQQHKRQQNTPTLLETPLDHPNLTGTFLRTHWETSATSENSAARENSTANEKEKEKDALNITSSHLNHTYAIITSGIGMVNAAAALATALQVFTPEIIICVGSAGGLHPKIRTTDVIIGSEYINSRADATAFGYAPGQIPGHPASIQITAQTAKKIQTAQQNIATQNMNITTYLGQMLSSDAFVTDANIEDTRKLFPTALSADMESQAYAQVAQRYSRVPFVAVRGISDLCGTPADQSISFHAELSEVARRAATVALEISRIATA